MKYIGSRIIETDRLILKPQTMEEQELLWKILMTPEVNKYYLTVPKKFKDKLLDWDKQKIYYEAEITHALDSDVFKWSIFLKSNGECIGRVSCHEANVEDESIVDQSIRGVGWYINPIYQGMGYGYEAAHAMIDYMFNEVNISKIKTGAAICNPASWKIMEKIGMKRLNETYFVEYTFQDDLVEDYRYEITKEEYSSKKAK